MNKRQLIDEIRQHNPTATAGFLAQFDEQALAQYLKHLETANDTRPVISVWTRKEPRLRMVG